MRKSFVDRRRNDDASRAAQTAAEESAVQMAVPSCKTEDNRRSQGGTADRRGDQSAEFLVAAWPILPVHVKEAITTLIDAALIRRKGASRR